MPPNEPAALRFLCDEMLVGLGRWLRIAGYDTAIAGAGASDRHVLARAADEGRLLLTRDRRLVERREARGRVLVLESGGIEDGAAELADRTGINWLYRPFSRCTVCNTLLENAGEHARCRLPDNVQRLDGPLTLCPACGRLYWEGSHVRRMRRRLETFAERAR